MEKKKKYKPLLGVNISSLADLVGEAATETLDGGKGVGDLHSTNNVGVGNTEDVVERSFFDDESLHERVKEKGKAAKRTMG